MGIMICIELRRWDYQRHDYLPYYVPAEWRIPLLPDDTDEWVNCCQCGKEIKFEDSYTSKEVHTNEGLGYWVCKDCNEAEMKRWELRE